MNTLNIFLNTTTLNFMGNSFNEFSILIYHTVLTRVFTLEIVNNYLKDIATQLKYYFIYIILFFLTL